ncbi:hypothetical protein BG015_005618 [Linnemannia schmuckeri]|uniref:FCP1 homology domain-containing protein n=1 Tax=Linnemannia schmuckeri TaxID=64567 RepID=A0A9P5S1F2_9FUNG|nr:hypothetical protein BG015_005618 [Linnemannia schmuckeri]
MAIDENRYYDEARKIFYPLTGIRSITPGYMDLAHQPPVKLDTPKKLLVILDLNGTLFYSADGRYKNRTYIKRPYFVELLRFLYANCRVMIWSSATRQRVSNMISGGGFVGLDKMDRVLTLKDLEFVWRAIETERSEAKPEQLLAGGRYEFCYDQRNTVLIDDSPHKTQLQPHNCMIVPDFDHTRVQSGGDQDLLKVIHYLNDLLYQDNVSAYMRTNPFDTDNAFYFSQGFRDKATALMATLKHVLKKDKKREARKIAQEKAQVEKTAEDSRARKLKKDQDAKGKKASDARKVEMARTAEMFRVRKMTEVDRIPLESRKAAHLVSPDWMVPDWTQQIAFEDSCEASRRVNDSGNHCTEHAATATTNPNEQWSGSDTEREEVTEQPLQGVVKIVDDQGFLDHVPIPGSSLPPTVFGNLPAKRVFRSNSPELARISSNATPSNNAQGNELSVSASTPLTPPSRSTTHYQHHPWQWRLTLTEEQHLTQRERGEFKGRDGEGDQATEVDLSVELRGLSIASSLPSSGPFGGFLLQYKSFGIVAKNTRFTLVSKKIDSSSALSLQAKLKASHVLDLDGYYNFAIVLSTESLVHETAMAPLGSIFPKLFLSLPGGFGGGCCPKSIDAIFDDPVSTDVVFIWQNKVLMVVATGSESGNDSGSDSDSDGGGGGGLNRYRVTLSRLYAHQAVLHQYPYFRRKLPLLSPSSQGGSPCMLMPRKLLVRDFSRPVFRLILGWLYTRDLDTTRIVDAQTAAPNDQPFTSNNKGSSSSSKQQDDHEARITWREIFQLADNMELPELRVRAMSMIRQAQQVCDLSYS